MAVHYFHCMVSSPPSWLLCLVAWATVCYLRDHSAVIGPPYQDPQPPLLGGEP